MMMNSVLCCDPFAIEQKKTRFQPLLHLFYTRIMENETSRREFKNEKVHITSYTLKSKIKKGHPYRSRRLYSTVLRRDRRRLWWEKKEKVRGYTDTVPRDVFRSSGFRLVLVFTLNRALNSLLFFLSFFLSFFSTRLYIVSTPRIINSELSLSFFSSWASHLFWRLCS